MNVRVRDVRYNDLDDIMVVENTCFSLPWSRESFFSELSNELACYQCAQIGNVIAGYMGMWKVVDEGHITNIAVLPYYRNKGIATLLMEAMVEICICSEIKSMTLEVRESNIPAIRLYEKFEFEAVGKRPDYYRKPKEDAILMTKNINYDYSGLN